MCNSNAMNLKALKISPGLHLSHSALIAAAPPRSSGTSAATERSQPSPLPKVSPHTPTPSPEGTGRWGPLHPRRRSEPPAPLRGSRAAPARSWRRLPGSGRSGQLGVKGRAGRWRQRSPPGRQHPHLPVGGGGGGNIYIYMYRYIYNAYMCAFKCLYSSPPPPSFFCFASPLRRHPLSSVYKKRKTKEGTGKKKKKQKNQSKPERTPKARRQVPPGGGQRSPPAAGSGCARSPASRCR